MNKPERIYHWQDSQLSIARHYGGCRYNGHLADVDGVELDHSSLQRYRWFVGAHPSPAASV